MRVQAGRKKKLRRGAAVVEFAVVMALILVPMILGLFEFGQALKVQQELDNAVREGARAGARPNATTSDVEAVVRNYMAKNAGFNDSQKDGMIVTTSGVTDNPGTQVSITASVTWSDISWLSVPRWITGTTSLQATAVMRKEAS